MTTWHSAQRAHGGTPAIVVIGEASGQRLLASLLFVAEGVKEPAHELTDQRTGARLRVRLPDTALQLGNDARALGVTLEVIT